MAQVDLFIDDEDVKAADSSNQFTFEVPTDAVKKGDVNKGTDRAEWIQTLSIVESKWYEDETKDKDGNTYKCITAELRFEVPSDATRQGKADPNAGRQFTKWIRIVPAAMKNKAHPKYKGNNFALGRLNGILRSIWGSDVIPKGAKTNLSNFYYAADGIPPAVVGKTIVTTMKQDRWNGKPQDDIIDPVPLELRR